MKINKRKWLNTSDSYHTGSIHWSFEEDPENNFNSVDLTIRDCSRSISLSFEIDTEKEKQATLKKLNLVCDVVTELILLVDDHDCKEFAKNANIKQEKDRAKRKLERIAEQVEINKQSNTTISVGNSSMLDKNHP